MNSLTSQLKKLMAAGLFLISISISSTSFAERHNDPIGIPDEVSALMLTAEYNELLAEVRLKAKKENKVLKIAGVLVLDISGEKYAFVNLYVKPANSEGTWDHGGAIVGKVKSSSDGVITFDGIYYSPPAEPPGGATVGN